MQRMNISRTASRQPLLVVLTVLVLTLVGVPSMLRAEEPTVEVDAEKVVLTFPATETVLTFALDDGWLLGLNEATIRGQSVTSGETVQRPVIAQDHGETRHIIQSYRLKDAAVRDGGVVLTLEAVATTDAAHLQDVFVMQGNPDRAEAEGMTPELEALRKAAQEAEAALDKMAAEHGGDNFKKRQEEFEKLEAALNKLKDSDRDTHVHGTLVQNRNRARNRFNGERRKALEAAAQSGADVAALQEAVAAWNAARNQRAVDFPHIHRDYYDFPNWRIPEEVARVSFARERAKVAAESGTAVGEVEWILLPKQEVVGGWPWMGWEQSFSFTLSDDLKVNHIATLGTWELGGRAVGCTLYALRYRGLGGLVHTFTDDGDNGIVEAFSTTEIIPGATGGAPLVSPVVGGAGMSGDRTTALQHRVGAWIAQPARGAGAPFFEFQEKGGTLFAGIPQRQGNLRALTESMPGDAFLSQTDLEFFALTNSHQTIPMRYLVLKAEDPAFTTAEIRTRYQEMDLHVRNVVSEELGFVQFEVLPGVHYMFDHNFGGQMRGLAGNIPNLAEEGVRRFETHHPGWINGRERNSGMAHIGGGTCDIYDFWPLDNTKNAWKDLSKASAKHDIAHYAWLTGMCRIGGPLHNRIGTDRVRWAFNRPDATSLLLDSTGYQGNNNFNIHNKDTRAILLGRLKEARETFGYQGFWADSFQNLFMSQLDWAQGTGDSLQRTWWEVLAEWSREGVSWTAESHSFPGQSCSIEVRQDWSPDTFFMTNQVNRAFRANSFPNPGEKGADLLAFGFLANKGWAAPDLRPGDLPSRIVPSFKRFAHEYLAALPTMRRPWQLPGDAGVLWLGYENDKDGVLFTMKAMDIPSGVKATPILDSGSSVNKTEARHGYRVQADDLLNAFGIRRGPETDERIGRTWTKAEYYHPDWAK